MVFAWALVGLTAAGSPPARAADVARGYEDLAARLDEAIRREVAEKELPALSIALVDGERIVWQAGFGFRDADRTQRATARTTYRVGSVSKLFTDIAVMRLVERKQLVLDAPITDYLPEFKPDNRFGKKITLRQLMSHRSGLVRESPVGHYFDPTEPTLRATVESLNETSLVYKPETKTKYSNAGVAVVGLALQEKHKTPFAKCIEDLVLKPLHTTHTAFEITPTIRDELADAWMWTYDGRRFEAPQFALGTAPAGNLYSNVTDLSKFLIALFKGGRGERGRILETATLRGMLTPLKGADGKPQKFGIGFSISDLDGHRKVGHGGAVYGYSTQLEALPDRKLGVAAVASLDGSNGVVRRISYFALRLLLAKQAGKPLPTLPATTAVPIERARQIAGRYRNKRKKKAIELTSDGNRSRLRRGGYWYDVRARKNELVVDGVFGYGPTISHPSVDVVVIENERFQRARERPPKSAPKRWKGLIGEYGWDHNTLYILEDGGRLYALIEWFYYYPLKELGKNRFAFPDYGLYHGEKLEFTRDEAGEATRVVAAEVAFERRSVGTRDGETFRIKPVKPIDELRGAALSSMPPKERGEFRESQLVELTSLEPSIQLDIRYATTNNFTGSVFYRQPRAFMQKPAAEAVVRAHRRLKKHGMGLLIHDAYRPWHVTKMFWDATPAEFKAFVANPANGSRHNRGCAVDLTLFDLKTGKPLQMVAGYDEFSPRSFPNYPGGTAVQRWRRALLRRVMEAEGFTIYELEWWHFDYRDWKKYRIQNATFEELLKEPSGRGK